MSNQILNLPLSTRSEIVRNVDVFQQLPDAAIKDLASKIKLLEFKAEQRIITKNEPGECMYVIIDGRVRVHDEKLVVAEFSNGNYFGEFSLLDSEPRSMSVTAVQSSVLGSISQDDFYTVLDANPSITKDVITTLITRLRERTSQIITQMKEREAALEKLVDQRTMELMQQKELVELKNKEILDSIHYAKRHQDAILPNIDILNEYFTDSFVLYIQKDIVAGDFYWTSTINDENFIVAADCTGHGVAGALMSMLGISLLDQIVNKKSVVNPAEILNELHEAVISSLKQQETDSNDGMDIAICKINLNELKLEYAGAYRPLWLIRDNNVITVVPDKMPIGGLQMKGRGLFSNNIVKLQPNDIIYIFSDGYADQFGGEKNKKLMTRSFRELLVENHQKEMSEQHTILKKYFEEWRGKNEQVDDVLLIGIKI